MKSHCVNGHALVPDNVHWQVVKSPLHKQERYPVCKTCRNASRLDHWHRIAKFKRKAKKEAA